MKLTVYKCDRCKQPLSDDVTRLQHVNIKGILVKAEYDPEHGWKSSSLTPYPESQYCFECLITLLGNKISNVSN